MTISSQTRTAGPFTGNGVATGGSFTFKVFAATDLIGVETSDLGVDRTLVYNTDFSVTLNADQNVSPGGTINYLIAGVGPSLIPTDYVLNFTSNVSNLQPVALTNAGGYFPRVINDALDRATILVQQLVRSVNSSIKFPLSDGINLTTTLPNKTARALKGIRFDANGNVALTLGDPDDTAGDAAAAAASASAAATSATGAASSATTATTQATAAAASAASAAASAAGMKYRAARAASTANVASLSGTTTIDGVVLIAGDRLLLKNQSTTADNGLYVIAAGAWARATDMDAWTEVPGTVVVVTEGTVNGDKVFLCTSNDGGTLGVTAITFIDWAAVIFDNTITAAKLIDSIINDLSTVTIASGDYVAIADASDSFKKKKALVSDIIALVTVPIAATQAEMEAASSTTVFNTPGRAQYHPGMAKAWVKFTGATGAITASYNVTSVTRNAAGDYTVNFTTAFSSANYGAQCTPSAKVSGLPIGEFGQIGTQAAGSCQVFSSHTNASGIQVLDDADSIYAVFRGDQ